jgi:hypothetical protein
MLTENKMHDININRVVKGVVFHSSYSVCGERKGLSTMPTGERGATTQKEIISAEHQQRRVFL